MGTIAAGAERWGTAAVLAVLPAEVGLRMVPGASAPPTFGW